MRFLPLGVSCDSAIAARIIEEGVNKISGMAMYQGITI